MNTCLELVSAETAPKNADESEQGVITTFSGTPKSVFLPLKVKNPFLTAGGDLTNIEHLPAAAVLRRRRRRNRFGKRLFPLVGENGERLLNLNRRVLKGAGAAMESEKRLMRDNKELERRIKVGNGEGYT